MAFQTHSVFLSRLQAFAASTEIAVRGPAENFMLDERVSEHRAVDYFRAGGLAVTATTSVPEWLQNHKNYSSERLLHRPLSATFNVGNEPAHLTGLNEQDVVRLETLPALCERGSVKLAEPTKLKQSVSDWVANRYHPDRLQNETKVFLENWLKKLNRASDRRPVFVAPYGEVSDLLAAPDWANRLRDALGLGHLRPSVGQPLAVVLFKYSLERVRKGHSRNPAWAAMPTVLDDPGTSGLSPCFFPAPQRGIPQEFGSTVSLSASEPSRSEFLHAPIDYELADIIAIGDVTTVISDGVIAQARDDHFERLRPQFQFRNDIPARS